MIQKINCYLWFYKPTGENEVLIKRNEDLESSESATAKVNLKLQNTEADLRRQLINVVSHDEYDRIHKLNNQILEEKVQLSIILFNLMI